MVCPLRAIMVPHWQRQHHLKGVARLGNKLNSTWTTRNVVQVNNKQGKIRWYKFLILMVKLFEKGDLCSKIANVRILLLSCAVARSINEKEKMRIIINLLVRCKEALRNNLA